jgi:hypothetical protein
MKSMKKKINNKDNKFRLCILKVVSFILLINIYLNNVTINYFIKYNINNL